MSLIKATNKNTNTEAGQINWPKTSARSNGNGFTNQNRSCGQFIGTLEAIRPITSQKDTTVFAVIDIAVPKKVGKFQDFLHFNPDKEAQSMSFLVNRVKAIAASAGYEDDGSDEEQDIDWVKNTIIELIKEKAQVHFIQERVERGLDIQYI